MSWQAVLHSLPLLTLETCEIFAPPREMEAAIASYNRALVNLRSDSADVAQIALRKLVINYPLFGPASLLFGICLFEQRRLAAASEVVERARLAGLSPHEARLAEALQEAIAELSPDKPAVTTEPGKTTIAGKFAGKPASRPDQPAGLSAPILERTGKPVKTRMASSKEVRKILRRGDLGEQPTSAMPEPENPLHGLSQLDWPRLALMAVAVLALIGVIAAVPFALRLLPSLKPTDRLPTDQERLSYLLGRLEELAPADPQVATLLQDYHLFVQPDSAASQSAELTQPALATTATETTAPTDADPTEPVATTEALSQTDLLTQIYHEYEAALILASSDVVTAAENLQNLEKAAANLAADTTSPAVPVTVKELQANIRQSLDMYRTDASDSLRIQGREAYDRKDHQVSLDLYLRAYALKPLAYGGGVAYYCGRNYQALGEFEKARPFYQFVIDNFAGSEVADYAAVRLAELG